MNARQVRNIIKLFDSYDINATYDWTIHSPIFTDEEYSRAQLLEVAHKEYDGIKKADVILFICPGKNGSHLELGVAIALGKPIIIYTNNQNLERIETVNGQERTVEQINPYYLFDNVEIVDDFDIVINKIVNYIRRPK